ncbi:DEAD/DEAH box helicase [Lachnospiraceae bacterium LCP25S3_G4]
MDNLQSVMIKIKSILDISEDKISSLNAMLRDIEINRIHDRFDRIASDSIFTREDMLSKANLLNAMTELILENPSLNQINENERRGVLKLLFETNSTIYEQLIKSESIKSYEKISIVVMYSMLSYLADKQTISNIMIEKYNVEILSTKDFLVDMETIDQLEFATFYLVVLMLSNIKNHDGLNNLNTNINVAQEYLEEAQNKELERENFDIRNGLKISAYGNIIYLVEMLKEYLFTGKVETEKNQEIYTLIDMYSYNAFYLLGNEEIELKLIGYLVKYAFAQVAENSIWNIAEKSPKIRMFIEKNLSEGERFLYSLLPSQRDVIAEVLTPKKSIIVSMPTSSGKSLLAEMQILFSLHNYATGEFKPTVCYVVPTNALIEQVKRDLTHDFKMFNFNIETALPYYEVDEIEEEILSMNHIDILVSTPEKLESLVRKNHDSIKNTRLVIMDEAHNIGDKSRGSKFELLLAAIKQNLSEANFLLLSPFISNAEEIAEWLADTKRNSAVLSMEWAPTRQYVGCNLLKNGKKESVLEFYKTSRNQLHTEDVEVLLRLNPNDVKEELKKDSINNSVKECVIINDFIDQEGNILVLCTGATIAKNLTRDVTNFFVAYNKLSDISSEYEIKKALEIIKLESGDNTLLYQCLKYGVCYHHSGLSSLVKETIEELIRNNKIKLLFATTTLAQGMNFPINTVIFDSVRFRGANARDISNAEFWNIAGRAGRAYKDKEGYIILPTMGTQKNTREVTKNYIKCDLEAIVSSLNAFFKDTNQIVLDYEHLSKTDQAPILNLIQYINHILHISYDYNIDSKDLTKIRSILNDSYLYHNLDKQEGYIKAQMKLNNLVSKYVSHINTKKKDDLEKADELGISDISYSKVKSMISAFILNLKENGDNDYLASKVIMESKNIARLSEIITIIARIPELNISMLGKGNLDPDSIARLLIGWVHGERVFDIAKEIKRENQSMEQIVEMCNKYLNSQMKSYMPWGMNVYQELSYDMNTDNAKLLPSFIYYGVSDKESVILSKVGVPRFAIDNVKKALKSKEKDFEITIKNIEKIRQSISNLEASAYDTKNVSKDIIKDIVNEKINR